MPIYIDMKSFIKFRLRNALTVIAFWIFGMAVYAEKITISTEWSTKSDNDKRNILLLAAVRMKEKDTGGKSFRLVINENEVYISDTSGESWVSWGASFFKRGTANSHNVSTHNTLLDMVYNPTQKDSRYRLLRAMHNDQESSISLLEQKNVTLKALNEFLQTGLKVDNPFS